MVTEGGMDIVAIAGAGLIAAAAAVLLKQYKPEYAMVLSLAAVAVFFGWILSGLLPALSTMREMAGQAADSTGALRVLIKCLGVCYLCEIAAEICKEAGQTAIASKVELAGRVAVLLLCLPMFEELLRIALTLIHL